jgi:hypothetical protein
MNIQTPESTHVIFYLPPELKCAIDFFTTFVAEIKLDLT